METGKTCVKCIFFPCGICIPCDFAAHGWCDKYKDAESFRNESTSFRSYSKWEE